MIVIGIVGGIGAGKTELLRLLAEKGARIVAADDLSREVLAPGQPTLEEIRRTFGQEYFDNAGNLKREKLGALVFQDETARQQLDRIMHPQMLARLRERLAQWEKEGVCVAAVEAAVLDEMGARPFTDYVVCVTAPVAVRRKRLQARGMSAAEAEKRLATHQRLGLDRPQADFVIENAGTLEELRRQAEQLWAQLVKREKKHTQRG